MEETEISTPAEQYAIDRNWYDQNHRSFAAVVQARMCPSCIRKLGQPIEEPFVTVDPAGKRVVTGRHTVGYGSNPLPILRDCCSRARGYIDPSMPTMEVAFRVLLARANQPLTLEELRTEMVAWTGEAERFRYLSTHTLQRMLDRTGGYGIRRIESGVVGE